MISLFYFFFVQSCIAFSPAPVLTTQDSTCQNASEARQKPSCWTALGYDDWFDTWKGPCPGSPNCTCSSSKPWSDCVLSQYQRALGSSNTTISCVNLTDPEACRVAAGDWTRLTENQLAIAYVSTAIENFYLSVYGWYAAITATPTPPTILNALSDEINYSNESESDKTKIHIATFLSSLLIGENSNGTALPNLKDVISQVVGMDNVVDVELMTIKNFQNLLGQALNQTLNAVLSDWNTSYFGTLGKDGSLLDNGRLSRKLATVNQELDQIAPIQLSNSSTNLTTVLSTNTRKVLSTIDSTEIWDYQILSCDASEPNGLAAHLTALLDTFHRNLFEVMLATSKGVRSSLGFPQLFKTQKWIPIRRLYEHMHNAVGTAGNLASSSVLPDNKPTFICLQPHKRETAAAYAVCAAQPRLRAFPQPGTPYAIGLCPAFWALPIAPVRAFCPWKGEMSQDYVGDALLLNQQSVLVLMLVRIYLGAQVLDPEFIGLNEVLALETEEAYWNPSTWAYWYASVIGCLPGSWERPDL